MTRRSWILFWLLAATWGASYLFIKIALEDDVSPAVIVFARTAAAALVLWPIAARAGALKGLRERVGAVVLLALVQVAAPFLLITVGEQEISSSLTGILVASAPIWTALLAVWIDQQERSHGWSLVGIGGGMAGVVLLLGLDAGGGSAAVVGGLMVVLASLGYAIGAFMIKRRFSEVRPVGLVTATMATSALMTAPWAALSGSALPDAGSAAALIALGVLGTGMSFVIFYHLIAVVGPARTSLVAYVAPGFAVLYGVSFLGEQFTLATLGGLVLIVGGSWVAAEGRLPGMRAERGEKVNGVPKEVPA